MVYDTQLHLNLYLEMFILHQQASRHTRGTVEYYRYNLTRFLRYLADHAPVQHPKDITPHHIRHFLASLEAQNLSGAYIHTYARCIKAWLNFLVREEVIDRSPMAKVTMPKINDEILPPFSEADIRAMLAACAPGRHTARDRAMILVLLDTGLRAAEFVAIQYEDIELDGVIKVLGKGRKERYVAMSMRTRKELLKYIAIRGDAPGPLWLGVERKPLQKNGVYLTMKRIGKRAGVWPVGLHRFRRTFAIASLRNGVDAHTLQMMLGHSDLSMARRYLKFAREDIIEASRRTSPVDNWRL